MNITTNIKRTIAGTALAGALVIGGAGAAFAADNDGAGSGKADRIATICEHQDEVVPRLTERQGNITERITKLQELSAKATSAGRTKAAARIDKRIATLNERLTKVTEKIANAPAWLAEHCS